MGQAADLDLVWIGRFEEVLKPLEFVEDDQIGFELIDTDLGQ